MATQAITERDFSRILRVKGQRGLGLIEVLIAVAVLGVIGATFLPAISSGTLRSGQVKESYTAQILARTQMEDIKSLPYDDTGFYPVTVSLPGDFNITVTAIDESPPEFPDTLQKIKMTVSHGDRQVVLLESYKAKRP